MRLGMVSVKKAARNIQPRVQSRRPAGRNIATPMNTRKPASERSACRSWALDTSGMARLPIPPAAEPKQAAHWARLRAKTVPAHLDGSEHFDCRRLSVSTLCSDHSPDGAREKSDGKTPSTCDPHAENGRTDTSDCPERALASLNAKTGSTPVSDPARCDSSRL